MPNIAIPSRNMNEDDPLEDFTHRQITLDGVTKRCMWRAMGRR